MQLSWVSSSEPPVAVREVHKIYGIRGGYKGAPAPVCQDSHTLVPFLRWTPEKDEDMSTPKW